MQYAKTPWRVLKHTTGNNYDGLIIIDANGWNVANLWHNNRLQDQEYIAQREANANLIAAAPDLLAALEAITKRFRIPDGVDAEEYAGVYNSCHTAIAKAKEGSE